MFIPDQESRAAFQSFMNEARVRIERDQAGRAGAPSPDPPRKSRAVERAPAKESQAVVVRIVRQTEAGRRVKSIHDFRCQVCGIRLERDDGPYAEACHIRPPARPHNGPDKLANLLCLCPNHHVLFEGGGFTVGEDLDLIGLPGKLRLAGGHPVGRKYLAYHRRLWTRAEASS